MKITAANVKKLSPKAQLELLVKILTRLDELDEDDFFGTEGWRHSVLQED